MPSLSPRGWYPRLRQSATQPGVALGAAFTVVLAAAAGAAVSASHRFTNLPRLELSGSTADIRSLVNGRYVDYLAALDADRWLVVCYFASLVVAGFVGQQVFLTRPARRFAGLALAAAVLAAPVGFAANRSLFHALSRLADDPSADVDALAQWGQGLAFTALVLLAVAIPVAVAVVATVVVRFAQNWWPGRPLTIPAEDLICASRKIGDTGARAAWEQNWLLPPGRSLAGTGVGICLSGGGIRSATFGLGALHALQEAGEVDRAAYLVGVSGGGFAAGAMRLALQSVTDDKATGPSMENVAGPSDVFAHGSPEFDHLRRHSKYLAEGTAQWLTALAVILRGLVVAQVMLLLTVILAGRGLGEIYRQVPALTATLSAPWSPAPGIAGGMLAPLGLAVGLWLIGVLFERGPGPAQAAVVLRRAAQTVGLLGVGMLLAGLLLPLLVAASTWAYEQFQPRVAGATSTAAGAAGVLTTGYIATIAGIFLATRKIAGPVLGLVNKNRAVIRALPAVLLQRLLVLVGVLVLIVAHLYVFARIVKDTTAPAKRGDDWPGLLQVWHFVVFGLLLALLAFWIDQTRWSLHPFYKERLMSAFAVRRVRADGQLRTQPYDHVREITDLDTHCTRVPGFPQVIFVAAAQVSGQEVAPPGRRALPYTLSGDWVGSPRLGWVRTIRLREMVKYPLRIDLTTQAAMAISGAAFASAMGAAATPHSLLFTMTNARLGTWLPNPWLLQQASPGDGADRPDGAIPGADSAPGAREQPDGPAALGWRLPRPPHIRRLTYLIREIFGLYRWDAPMLLLTDGGHYENLGLVELLRHAPNVVYCFDASGGSNVMRGALGPAIALAREELGIEITFAADSNDPRDNPASLVPGSAGATAGGPLGAGDALAARLAGSSVLVGTIRYPECAGKQAHENGGRLYVGIAGLTGDTPWEVLAYASRHATFPHDRTSDQWFNHEQFDAYHSLGLHVGRTVLRTAEQRGDRAGGSGPGGSPVPTQSGMPAAEAQAATSAVGEG